MTDLNKLTDKLKTAFRQAFQKADQRDHLEPILTVLMDLGVTAGEMLKLTQRRTPEDDLQDRLDDEPANHQLRLVLADYLEGIGDERAEGYRMLGWLRRVPQLVDINNRGHGTRRWRLLADYGKSHYEIDLPDVNVIPTAWRMAHPQAQGEGIFAGTRRECEDLAAKAWSRLSDEDKDKIRSSNTLHMA